jgi:hypothetical protein
VGDVYALRQALPRDSWPGHRVIAHPTTSTAHTGSHGGNSAEPLVMPTRNGEILGIPTYESTALSQRSRPGRRSPSSIFDQS